MTSATVSKVEESIVTVRSPALLKEQFRHAPHMKGKPMKIALVHARGTMTAAPCGGIAFFYGEMPQLDATIEAHLARNLDGTIPETKSKVRCGTCQAELHLESLDLYVDNRDERKTAARRRQKQARKKQRK